MNEGSSRSHSIFTVTVETTERFDGEDAAAPQPANDDGHIRVGKLNLVDLAGSERQSKTGATGRSLALANVHHTDMRVASNRP
jgi:hypothetical protein